MMHYWGREKHEREAGFGKGPSPTRPGLVTERSWDPEEEKGRGETLQVFNVA